ncbi:UPF0606 protein KIAA1549-like isoform X2 [Polyodon spathula]|uniref:UPF0606 protein KIAA1549-like isoform X2 n=1 Tax=Polyodon spathula TaxID=7913 RepID=UPI001B7DC603|nr:UPF0606 protein KIAA1549-like isoform X2 [Polyodon spathula]
MEGMIRLVTGSDVVCSRTSWLTRAYCAFLLGSVLLVSVATSSPVSDEHLMGYNYSSYLLVKIQEETSVPTDMLHTALTAHPTGAQAKTTLPQLDGTLGVPSKFAEENVSNTQRTGTTLLNLSPSVDSRPLTSTSSSASLTSVGHTNQQSMSAFTKGLTESPVQSVGSLKSPVTASSEQLHTASSSIPSHPFLEMVGDPAMLRTSLPLHPFSDYYSSTGEAPSKTPGLSDTIIGTNIPYEGPSSLKPLMLFASFVPFLRPYTILVTEELTLVPTKELYSAESIETDFGSGDYLETMTLIRSEVDELSPFTSLPVDMYGVEESSTEVYDTSFPLRPVLSLSSMYIATAESALDFSSSYDAGFRTIDPTSVYSSHSHTSLDLIGPPEYDISDNDSLSDWNDEPFPIEPTELLLPDMNSLEYYSTLLAIENASLSKQKNNRNSTEHTGHVSSASVKVPGVVPTGLLVTDTSHLFTSFTVESSDLSSLPSLESSTSFSIAVSSFEPSSSTSFINSTLDPFSPLMSETSSLNVSEFVNMETSGYDSSMISPPQTSIFDTTPTSSLVEPLVVQTHAGDLPASLWDSWVESTAAMDHFASSNKTAVPPAALPTSEVETTPSTSSAFKEEPILTSSFFSVQPTTRLPDIFISSISDDVTPFHTAQWFAPSSVGIPMSSLSEISVSATSVHISPSPTELTSVIPAPSPPPVTPTTNHSTNIETNPTENIVTSVTDSTIVTTRNTESAAATAAIFTTTTVTISNSTPIADTTPTVETTTTTTALPYLCDITTSDLYLVRLRLAKGAQLENTKAYMKEALSVQFNRSVKLQVLNYPPNLTILVTSGPIVYTAIAVINALHPSIRDTSPIASLNALSAAPDHQFQVHTVLQFVPNHVDVRFCNFSERIEQGLTMAFSEVRRRYRETTRFTVHVLNITTDVSDAGRLLRSPVDITFAIQDSFGFLSGSDVSNLMRILNTVEFSFYLGFPVLQIAEPFHYPELNVTHLLRSSWVKTVVLGVYEQGPNDKKFQAEMERKLAQLLAEVLGPSRRWRRATNVGNNSVQIVKMSRIEGSDNPLELIYFVEGQNGERLNAVSASSLINRIDLQRAAIVLGYRVQGTLAQPVEKISAPPSETQNNNLWIIVGVVVPVIVVAIIIMILYWKLCRTDKLDFQPDTMSNVQQRQKLQAPSVKGFDFAKLHLGQHNKDDILVIQEPAPPPMPVKEMTLSEKGDVPSPTSKTSSKPCRGDRRRGRISPSDAESTVSEPSSGRESAEESMRASVTKSEAKQQRKVAKNGPPQSNGTEEQLSSASIFDHVDRISRSSEASKRLPNKIQLIAMQPMPAPPIHNPVVTETSKINKEIQSALRHKSEIEHHRNKIRLRAKRKGHYDFPVMDDIGVTDTKENKRIYEKAQLQIDKILNPDIHVPSVFLESRKSSRGKRSPKQRRKNQVNGNLLEADKDRLLTTDSDGTYRRPPGVNNVAYVSDPDQPQEQCSPSPQENEVFFTSPTHSPIPPTPSYLPPQPSIEEARQQMHSLLDDAFALVAPNSHGSNAGIKLPGVTVAQPDTSPPARTNRGTGTGQWGSLNTPCQGPNPFSARYAELGMSPPSGLLQSRQGLGSGYLQSGDPGQQESLYSSRGLYGEDIPSSARPRPVGGTTGAQLHHLTQVGLSSRMSSHPGQVLPERAAPNQPEASGWAPYRTDEEFTRMGQHRDPAQMLGFPDYSSSSMFQMPRTALRELAPAAHLQHSVLEPVGTGFPSEAADEPPPGHSSASLIKAIREELMRLSQKQSAVQSFHS